jgi:hypothetical protein
MDGKYLKMSHFSTYRYRPQAARPLCCPKPLREANELAVNRGSNTVSNTRVTA